MGRVAFNLVSLLYGPTAAIAATIPGMQPPYLVTQGHVMTGSVTVTERAAKRIVQIVSNDPENNMLRVSVEGGGCSGFEYRFDLVSNAEPEAILIERAGAKVLVDSLSLTYLTGSEIDYVDDLMTSSFKIKNPNATAACGCGTSFSV
jgi:iron-sulfur cluster assembly accessory protein